MLVRQGTWRKKAMWWRIRTLCHNTNATVKLCTDSIEKALYKQTWQTQVACMLGLSGEFMKCHKCTDVYTCCKQPHSRGHNPSHNHTAWHIKGLMRGLWSVTATSRSPWRKYLGCSLGGYILSPWCLQSAKEKQRKKKEKKRKEKRRKDKKRKGKERQLPRQGKERKVVCGVHAKSRCLNSWWKLRACISSALNSWGARTVFWSAFSKGALAGAPPNHFLQS